MENLDWQTRRCLSAQVIAVYRKNLTRLNDRK
jgi:hypothetical protein